jgi:soluble P-type ATPase
MGDIKEKLIDKQKATIELGLEAKRRMAVAQEKLAGYLIEYIESEREKQKKKKLVGDLLGSYLKINNLKNHINIALGMRNNQFGALIITYDTIKSDVLRISEKFGIEKPEFLSINGHNSIHDLYLVVGHIEGYIVGKLVECM